MKARTTALLMTALAWGLSGPAPVEGIEFLPRGGSWTYRRQDPQSEPEARAGKQWYQKGYVDADWLIGQAPFGYGDQLRAAGGIKLPAGPGRYFFRREFKLDGEIGAAALQVAGRDSGVVYINEQLVDKSTGLQKDTGAVYWNRQIQIKPDILHPGTNLIAAGLDHQPGSSNAYFDLQLVVFGKKEESVLEVFIYDDETRRPLEARCYVKGADGKNYGPRDTLYYPQADHRFYADGYFRLALPPGKTEVTVCRGPEREVVMREEELAAGKISTVEILLKRFGVNLIQEGWYGGDAQVQWVGHGGWGYFSHLGEAGLMPSLAVLACKAEGYAFSMFSLGAGPDVLPCAFGGAEDFSEFNGHTDLLFDETAPEISRMREAEMAIGHFEQYPGPFFNIERYQIMEQYRGLAYPAHPEMGPFDNPFVDSGWAHNREYPIDIALGRLKCWNLGGGVDTWLKFLNLGFRLTGLTETDAYLNWSPGVGPATYLKIDPSTSCNAVEAYRQGKVFVGYGPLVFLKVQGKGPGETVLLKEAQALKVELSAQAFFGLDKIQLIRNGDVAREIPGEGRRFLKQSFTIPGDQTGYILAVVHGRTNNFFGTFAAVNPVYIRVAGQPLKVKEADLDYFLNYLKNLRALFREYGKNPAFKRWAAGDPPNPEGLRATGMDPDAPLDKDTVNFYNTLTTAAEKVYQAVKEGQGPDYRTDFHPYIPELDDIQPDEVSGMSYEKSIGYLPKTGIVKCLGYRANGCYDPAGNLYVASGEGGSLQKFDPDFNIQWSLGGPGGGYSGMACNGRYLFCVGYYGESFTYSAANGAVAPFNFRVPALPIAGWQMGGTLQLETNQNTLIFAAAKVVAFNAETGALLRIMDAWPALNSDLLSARLKRAVAYPAGIRPGLAGKKEVTGVLNPVNRDIAVIEGNSLIVFDQQGQCRKIIEQINPQGVALDGEGNIWVVGGLAGRVYNARGEGIGQLPPGNAVAYDEQSHTVFIADAQRISQYDRNGKLLAQSPEGWFKASRSVGGGEHSGCQGLRVYQDELYFTSFSERKIKKVKADRLAGAIPADVISDLDRPTGLDFDRRGNLYVALAGSHKLRKYTPADQRWSLVWEKGSVPTRGRAQFRYPAGVAVAGDRVYVADLNNNRIKTYDLEGKLLTIFGRVGEGDYRFNHPADVAARTSQGTTQLVVVDRGNGRVVMYRGK